MNNKQDLCLRFGFFDDAPLRQKSDAVLLTSSYANYYYSFMLNEDKKDNIIYLTIYLRKLIDKDFDNRLSEYGLTGQQGRILFFIFHSEKEIHQNDIENEFHLSKSTVSGLVKRMEKKDVININKQARYTVITVSDKGKEIICHLKDRRQEAVDRLTKDLNEKQKEEICNYLVKMIRNMEGGNS